MTSPLTSAGPRPPCGSITKSPRTDTFMSCATSGASGLAASIRNRTRPEQRTAAQVGVTWQIDRTSVDADDPGHRPEHFGLGAQDLLVVPDGGRHPPVEPERLVQDRLGQLEDGVLKLLLEVDTSQLLDAPAHSTCGGHDRAGGQRQRAVQLPAQVLRGVDQRLCLRLYLAERRSGDGERRRRREKPVRLSVPFAAGLAEPRRGGVRRLAFPVLGQRAGEREQFGAGRLRDLVRGPAERRTVLQVCGVAGEDPLREVAEVLDAEVLEHIRHVSPTRR
ncbi:hypothetical protein ACWEFJ_24340 [Actinosynnema sp. NPDC004786]